MLKDILKTANLYTEGLNQVEARRDQWMIKFKELRDHLKEVATYLNENATYKQGFYVDTMHAYMEDIGGTCSEMSSVTFRSGAMPMLVKFRNSMGERKEFMEEGFRISFNPTVTGQIMVLLYPHNSVLNQEPPQYLSLAYLDEPAKLTMEIADRIISKGMEAAYYTSFTGIARQAEGADEKQDMEQNAPKYNPIGFKHYETTEKVN